MKNTIKKVCLSALFVVGYMGLSVADQAPNPRAVANNAGTSVRASGTNVSRSANTTVSRADTNVAHLGRSAANISRSAVSTTSGVVRSGIITPIVKTIQRSITPSARSVTKPATLARATAVFSDTTKMGTGYSQCRESYATCMDQFCANANDNYRRCFCSSKFAEYRDTENALSQAVTLLAQFEDNNLNAVDKTAQEVKAMYSATAGELAIKRDTSAASKLLENIDNLLSGKSSSGNKNTFTSLNGTTIDFSVNINDIWSTDSSSSIFGSSYKDLSTLEGIELYNAAHNQCMQVINEYCDNDAVFNMARSAYSIMITQDCNAYSKKVEAQREQVKQTVRTAEKYLREARLEEYRAHNSADMNACITAVRNAIQGDAVCGANYKKCLDNTGAYIDSNGEPIYSPRLFKLNDLIGLSGDVDEDVLKQNSSFVKFLDSKRKYAVTALDTCRTIADDVWTEFKRSALIEIAQAQDEKIEEVKMSCVNVMAECYDVQSEGLKNFDKSTAKTAGALGVAAARNMCADKVITCASLFGNTTGCEFDGNGQLKSGTGNSGTAQDRCGLTALLDFVDTVDDTRVNEACDVALENKLKELCTPEKSKYGYPYNCRLTNSNELEQQLETHAELACQNKDGDDNSDAATATITRLINELEFDMDIMLAELCEDVDGYWYSGSDSALYDKSNDYVPAFYSAVYGGTKNTYWGRCLQYTEKLACEMLNSGDVEYATYNTNTNECILNDDWYEHACVDFLDGYWTNDMCYVLSPDDTSSETEIQKPIAYWANPATTNPEFKTHPENTTAQSAGAGTKDSNNNTSGGAGIIG